MKILVYGHKGWIGSMFINILKEKGLNYYTTIALIEFFFSYVFSVVFVKD